MKTVKWEVTAEPQGNRHHMDRIALMRLVIYETMVSEPLNPQLVLPTTRGEALSLNISSRGMLLLMDREPHRDQVMRLSVPSPLVSVNTPTLADIRWVRKVPLSREPETPLYFVGVRFLL